MSIYRQNAIPKGAICPGCKQPTLRKRADPPLPRHQCDKCGGVWLGARNFNRVLVESKELSALADVVPDGNTPTEVKYRDCPRCREQMQRINFWRTSGIMLDACKQHGVWFDVGEIRQLSKLLSDGKRPERTTEQPAFRQPRIEADDHGIDAADVVFMALGGDPGTYRPWPRWRRWLWWLLS